jgi:hypothetical protein
MIRLAFVPLAAVVTVLALGSAAGAQTVPADVANALRVEWQRVFQPSRIEGYVHNDSAYRIGLVRLRVQGRDAERQAPHESLAWVYGNVPAGSRWSFSVRVPPTVEVAGVTIESFSLIAREGRPESP